MDAYDNWQDLLDEEDGPAEPAAADTATSLDLDNPSQCEAMPLPAELLALQAERARLEKQLRALAGQADPDPEAERLAKMYPPPQPAKPEKKAQRQQKRQEERQRSKRRKLNLAQAAQQQDRLKQRAKLEARQLERLKARRQEAALLEAKFFQAPPLRELGQEEKTSNQPDRLKLSEKPALPNKTTAEHARKKQHHPGNRPCKRHEKSNRQAEQRRSERLHQIIADRRAERLAQELPTIRPTATKPNTLDEFEQRKARLEQRRAQRKQQVSASSSPKPQPGRPATLTRTKSPAEKDWQAQRELLESSRELAKPIVRPDRLSLACLDERRWGTREQARERPSPPRRDDGFDEEKRRQSLEALALRRKEQRELEDRLNRRNRKDYG